MFYSFDFDTPRAFPVPRLTGLNVTAEPLENGTVRFELVVPKEGFTAHNNCQVLEKILTYGHYRLMETTPDSLRLARYGSQVEHTLAHQIISIEFSFTDSAGIVGMDHEHE